MREQPIEEEELRLGAGDRASYAGEVMQLPKCAGKCGLAALVRTGHDEDSFSPFQIEIVANDGRVFLKKLMGQGDIENVLTTHFPVHIPNVRVTEVQSGAL